MADASLQTARNNDDGVEFRQDAHAVVIGIDRYEDPAIRDLEFARADAQAIYEVLTHPELGRFEPENVTLLLDEEATRRNVVGAIATQLPRRVREKNTVCVYFAGHGAPDIDQRSASRDGLEKYLVPHDGHLADLRATAINMEDISKYFGYIDAGQVIFYVDSCYSGAAGGRTLSRPDVQTRSALSDEFLDHLGNEGRLIITACSVNEVSLEEPALAHGVFTHYLLEGMKGAADANGDGLVSVDELYDYVWENVTRRARELRGKMTPVRKGSVKGRVYLTQYVTEDHKRGERLHRKAEEAFDAGDLDSAFERWSQTAKLIAGHKGAARGLKSVRDRRIALRAALAGKKRALLAHLDNGELPPEEYARGLALLGKGAAQLSGSDRRRRQYLEYLVEGKMTAADYLETVALLGSEQTPSFRDTEAVPDRAQGPSSVAPTGAAPAVPKQAGAPGADLAATATPSVSAPPDAGPAAAVTTDSSVSHGAPSDASAPAVSVLRPLALLIVGWIVSLYVTEIAFGFLG